MPPRRRLTKRTGRPRTSNLEPRTQTCNSRRVQAARYSSSPCGVSDIIIMAYPSTAKVPPSGFRLAISLHGGDVSCIDGHLVAHTNRLSPAAFTAPHPGPTAVRSTGTRWRVLCTDLTRCDFLSNPRLRHRKPCICCVLVAASSVRNHVLVFIHLRTLPMPFRARANFRREHHLPHRSGFGDHTTEHHCNSMLAPQT